jgi:trans-aconitate 2-methyltransferase
MTSNPPPDAWDPATYGRFRAQRRQPFDDLLALVAPVPGGVAVDLGCGSGELTADLHRQLLVATTIGVDRSANMLEGARALSVDGLRFEQGDLASWSPPGSPDVIFANASFQWVPDHPGLLTRLRGQLAPGGQLAVQMPNNFDHSTHTVADRVGQRYGVEALERFEAVLAPEQYASVLDELGFDDIHVRMQVYVHPLPSTASVIDWVAGTLLTQYRAELSTARYEAFLSEYRGALLAELGDPAGTKPYTHLFKRILFRARLSM